MITENREKHLKIESKRISEAIEENYYFEKSEPNKKNH